MLARKSVGFGGALLAALRRLRALAGGKGAAAVAVAGLAVQVAEVDLVGHDRGVQRKDGRGDVADGNFPALLDRFAASLRVELDAVDAGRGRDAIEQAVPVHLGRKLGIEQGQLALPLPDQRAAGREQLQTPAHLLRRGEKRIVETERKGARLMRRAAVWRVQGRFEFVVVGMGGTGAGGNDEQAEQKPTG